MAEKNFTREEAEKLIPTLEPMVLSLIENKKSAMEIGEELIKLQEKAKLENGKGVEASDLVNKKTELDFLIKIINEGLDAIEELGCQPKDLDLGLIDFPSIINGEQVLLCWKLGEKSIRYYHRLNEGFAGRKPLW